MGKVVHPKCAMECPYSQGSRPGTRWQICSPKGAQGRSPGGGSCPDPTQGTCHRAGRWQVKRIWAAACAQSLGKDAERDQP